MGRSIASADNLKLPSGHVADARADTHLSVAEQGQRSVQTLSRGGLSASYEARWVVGADIVGYTFLTQHGNYIFQAPLSWYRTKGWDLTPGYESQSTVDVEHPVLTGCLFCHTNSARSLPGTRNRFKPAEITAISCERCHGPADRHLASPVAGSIVNPAQLPLNQRDSVCEQCHLEGAVRVRNPGRDWWDFQPGQAQESAFVTYVESRGERGIKAVSQAEQLSDSRCARASAGVLWCGSCHDAHGEPTTAASVQVVCLSCHNQLFASGRHRPEANACVSCHMPQLRAENVAHAAVTDHTIPRIPLPVQSDKRRAKYTVHAWREPDREFRDRDFGLALLQVGASQHDAVAVKSGYDLLARFYLAGGSKDAEVVSALASVLLDSNNTRLAARMFAAASLLNSQAPENFYGLAEALDKSGERSAAISALKRAIAVDPSYINAYLTLAELYAEEGKSPMQAGTIEDYLKFMPGSIRFRLLTRSPAPR